MKKTLIILSVITVSLSANAQKVKESDVPVLTKNKFTSMYPAAKVSKWEKEEEGYEAEFDENKLETSVVIDAKGNHVQTEVEIAVASLPKGVGEYAKANLAGKKIDEASKITDAKSVITYEAEVGDVDYIFDDKGNFLKKIIEEEKEEDDDDKK